LLERAKSNIDFAVIKTDEKLRFSEKHRIIKLHGCFSLQGSYIITQEDYRTYEAKHPLLSNTIKQSLIENFFCFMGFSGDDPNFLNWYGWVKDNFKKKDYALQIYFIGLYFSESEKIFLQKNNITPVELSCLCCNITKDNVLGIDGSISKPEEINDYKIAYLRFFDMLLEKYQDEKKEILAQPSSVNNYFELLEKPDNVQAQQNESDAIPPSDSVRNIEIFTVVSKWPEEKYIGFYNEKDMGLQYKDLIAAWKLTHENYPGWIVLSDERRQILRRNTDEVFVYHLKKVDDPVDLEFLYEFNWRIEKCYHPLYTDWATIYETVVKKYNLSSKFMKNKHLRYCWIELQLALLKYYRKENMGTEWRNIVKNIENIEKNKKVLSAEQLERYKYEKCLKHLFSLELPSLRNELEAWDPNKKYPYFIAKKAALFAELGDTELALTMLESAIRLINKKQNILKPDYTVFSQKAYMIVLFDYIKRSNNHMQRIWSEENEERNKLMEQIESIKKYECDPWGDLSNFESLLKINAPEYKHTELKYGFELGSTAQTKYWGSDTYTLLAYSFLLYMEDIGFPFRLPGITFGKDAASKSLQRLQKFSPIWSLIILIRTGESKNIDLILNRKTIAKMQSDYAENLSLEMLKTLKKSKKEILLGDTFLNHNLGISLSSILPEFLGRLSIKCRFHIKKEMLNFIKKLYKSKERYKYKISKMVKLLINSFSREEQYTLFNDLLDFPVLSNDDPRFQYPDPFSFIDINNAGVFEKNKIDAIKIDNSIKMALADDYKREKHLFRLVVLWRYNLLSDLQIQKFIEVLWKFRNNNGFPKGTENIFYYSAFLWFPHPDDLDTKELLQSYFLKTDFQVQEVSKENGVIMTHGKNIFAGNLIGTFNMNSNYVWSSSDLGNLCEKIINWWDLDKHYLKDAAYLRDEFQSRFNNMLNIFACVFQPNISSFDSKHSIRIEKLLSELNDYTIPNCMARASFIGVFPKALPQLIDDISNALCSKNEKIILDAIGAIMVLLRQKCNGIDSILKIICENIKYRIEFGISRFLSAINEIIKNHPEYITNAMLFDIVCGLSHLIIETIVVDDDTEKEVHAKLICRKQSVALGATLKNYYLQNKKEIPLCIYEYEKIAFDPDEMSEIRNAWLNASIKINC
jgi:hypothetical protein